jgi:hypothetical protein
MSKFIVGILVVILSCLFLSSAHSAEWVYIYGSPNSSRFYYDKSSISFIQKDKVRAWTKIKKVDGSFQLSLIEYRCQNKMTNVLSLNTYNEEGKVEETYSLKKTDWQPVVPDSIMDLCLTEICSAKNKGKQVKSSKESSRGNWIFIDEGDANKKHYYDKNDLKYLSRNRVILRHKSQNTDSTYTISKREIDCAEKRIRQLSVCVYDKDDDMMMPEIIRDSDWSYIKPDTIGEDISTLLCK